ncbi:MAG: hypothetical protein A3I77_04325 [Gammaproteobacteria bacterium RIFCSPLOWO2_02_FULL_42_14]|nr:MAG: hypothetical protein A3B71_05625 [Gammaproteobacteria bacterium RIFCSPHIGHO2_02_FULL_42_43]OGT28433.1 MAG: hypothetical protein A2624_01130 [Gammaproteobacteria bacterium RIFCSPHIGHO2_01_FULL_42_8]OGT51472.1 MAG: hypothetical protein A3E54_05390 [Gammaproteobacteria bacterium RIFCSPHIGHO2_12_FULL_41_25]OGT62173.1 MAG: hypothetical protein A3I77_04325 [Gammaproteobacteria bacterium RIFCSPLOWO2_02_FULL_42_14]OGT85846.1 MAG: hypothetical protein A3G86_04015 [Gammaproteobacteria bacterium R
MTQNNPLLIFRLGSVGDTVVALPGFRLIQKAFPNVKRYVITNKPVNNQACALELMLENMGLVDQYIEYPSKGTLIKKCISLRKIIRDNQFHTMVYFHQNRHLLQAWRDFIFFKCCGIKKIIGLPLLRHGFQYQYDFEKKIYESEHKRLARQLKALGTVNWSDDQIIDLALTNDEKKSALTFIPKEILDQPFIICSIGTKLAMKDWGQENWLSLMMALSKQYSHYGLVFVGVESEYQRSEMLLNYWHGKKINLCGKLSVRETAAVIECAQLFIGHDSGPMHLASAVKTPSVAIFSRHAKPGCWYPLGQHHKVLYPKGKTILSTQVSEVALAVQDILMEV